MPPTTTQPNDSVQSLPSANLVVRRARACTAGLADALHSGPCSSASAGGHARRGRDRRDLARRSDVLGLGGGGVALGRLHGGHSSARHGRAVAGEGFRDGGLADDGLGGVAGVDVWHLGRDGLELVRGESVWYGGEAGELGDRRCGVDNGDRDGHLLLLGHRDGVRVAQSLDAVDLG